MTEPSYQEPCRKCGQRAPVVLKGLSSHCAVCGHKRIPLSATPVNVAGKPSRIGGKLARFAGVFVLVFGFGFAATLALILQSLLPTMVIGYGLGAIVSLLTLFVGGSMVMGGRHLEKKGLSRTREVQLQGLTSLSKHHKGVLTPEVIARSLDIPVGEVDELMGELAKDPTQSVAVDFDDDGKLHYLFGEAGKQRIESLGRFRIAPGSTPWDELEAAEQEHEAAAQAANKTL